MKKITMFKMEGCPYCRRAFEWMDELKKEEPLYASLDIHVIDEDREPETAGKYDYYYVPTFYVAGKKLHEGAATKAKIKAVFDAAVKT